MWRVFLFLLTYPRTPCYSHFNIYSVKEFLQHQVSLELQNQPNLMDYWKFSSLLVLSSPKKVVKGHTHTLGRWCVSFAWLLLCCSGLGAAAPRAGVSPLVTNTTNFCFYRNLTHNYHHCRLCGHHCYLYVLVRVFHQLCLMCCKWFCAHPGLGGRVDDLCPNQAGDCCWLCFILKGSWNC